MFGEQKMAHSSITLTWWNFVMASFELTLEPVSTLTKIKATTSQGFSITCVCVCLNWNTVIIYLKSRNELYKHRQHDNIYILASSTFLQGCQFNRKTTVKCHPSETTLKASDITWDTLQGDPPGNWWNHDVTVPSPNTQDTYIHKRYPYLTPTRYRLPKLLDIFHDQRFTTSCHLR